jgi:NAD(P)-dependent dehydrogenase (short-subunit alcohol dehydrogenase family)
LRGRNAPHGEGYGRQARRQSGDRHRCDQQGGILGSARANTLSDADNERKLAKLEHNLAQATSLPRTGHVSDIANAALFLASDEGSFVNSHDLVVDGGRISQYYERPAPAK